MDTATPNAIPPEVLADLQAVIEATTTGKPLDPEVAKRVAERSARAREENLKKFGVQDIGVSIIREMRGGE